MRESESRGKCWENKKKEEGEGGEGSKSKVWPMELEHGMRSKKYCADMRKCAKHKKRVFLKL